MKTRDERRNRKLNSQQKACCMEAATGSRKPLIFGLVAALAVIGFYLGLITLTSDWYNARAQFNDFRWWIVTLALGLGLQVGLFTHMRRILATAQHIGRAPQCPLGLTRGKAATRKESGFRSLRLHCRRTSLHGSKFA